MNLFLITYGALFTLMNPLGTVPIFVDLLKKSSKRQRSSISFWTSVNVLLILLISFFIGKYIISFFGISLDALKIAGGLIIISSGYALLTGTFVEHKGMKKKRVKTDVYSRREITITPLAIPMLAGPGTIYFLIVYNQEYKANWEILIILSAILMATASIYVVLRSSYAIVKTLGASGINAISRIIGLIVIAIGVEDIISSIVNIINGLNC